MLTPNFNPFPELKTERIVLRRIIESDAPAILSLRSDERVMQFIDRPRAQSIEDALELITKIDSSIESNDGINWGISLIENPELIGTIAFWRIDKPNYRAEIGYMLGHEFHGKGLMQEAISTVIKFGFEQMQLHSIEANVNPGNTVSKKILEKNGFVQEAYFKENYYYNGKFLDSVIYSLVKGG
jgi:ribosomal-protein-alanine N-acetyltransferase